uniref:Secreted glycoprotein, X-linked n=1 Tax=Myotis myotis TaxID=51298 RepID=A0A7J7YDB2_MYOMY|nr:secreted glycoprotein, X-linked [Myotis myotis]
MNLFIFVLLLSIWANNCLHENQSDGSTTGAKQLESSQTEDSRKHIFIIVVGIMSTAFICTFCCLHYNCLSRDAPEEKLVKKRVASKSSKSFKLFSKHKTDNECTPEKQPMLSGIDMLSELSSQERTFISSSSENVIRSSSSEKSSKPSSKTKFIKPSDPKSVSRSFHLGKSYRKHSLDKPHKLVYAHKVGSYDHSSYPNRAVSPTSIASLHFPLESTKPHHPTCRRSQTLLPESSSLKKFTKSPIHHNIKRSVIASRADMLSTSPLVKSCAHYMGKRPVCRTPESLVSDISEVKNTNAQNPPFPREEFFSKCFHKVDSRDYAFHGDVKSSDDDSEREITIFCNVRLKEVIVNKTTSNKELNKNNHL